MPFEFPGLRQIGAAEATQIVRHAESLIPAGAVLTDEGAKQTLANAALHAFAQDWFAEILRDMAGLVEDHEMIEGERTGNEAAWDHAIGERVIEHFGAAIDKSGVPVFPASQLSTPEGRDAAATLFADHIADFHKPDSDNAGKFLSSIGLVADHWRALLPDAIPETFTTTQVADLLAGVNDVFAETEGFTLGAAAAPVEDDMDNETREMLGLPPRAAAAPAPSRRGRRGGDGQHTVAGGRVISTAPPAASDVPGAYKLLAEACDLSLEDLAKALGVGKSTVANYLSGRTSRIQCSTDQARRLVAECDARAAKLHTAAVLFAKAIVP